VRVERQSREEERQGEGEGRLAGRRPLFIDVEIPAVVGVGTRVGGDAPQTQTPPVRR